MEINIHFLPIDLIGAEPAQDDQRQAVSFPVPAQIPALPQVGDLVSIGSDRPQYVTKRHFRIQSTEEMSIEIHLAYL